MKHVAIALAAMLAFAAPAGAQETLTGLGRINGYTGVVFDTSTTKYDILVDQSKPTDAAARRYATIHEAIAAAPEGARDKPTVIGLMPDVYQLKGTLDDPGLRITKDNITLVGLTDDRRKVVLADNRGNKQGASNNGWSMEVDADGFSAINLTFLNYCNIDYEYPGDPSKNLKKKSDTITQALALRSLGDRHVYSHVALLSRLDTYGNRTTRSYFTHSYIEGTDDFLGQRDVRSVWEDSEIQFSNPGGILFGGGTAFIRTHFKAREYVHFFKAVVPPIALIDSVLPDTELAWHAWRQPATLGEHSWLFNSKRESGKAVKASEVLDSAVGNPRHTLGRDLTETQARAFNPWNMLRWNADGVDDGWDPAGVRAKYEGYGALPIRVTLTNGAPHIRTGEASAEIGAAVFPAISTKAIHWSTTSKLVKLSATTGGKITVTGANTTDKTQVIPITASADNGLSSTAYVTVDPPLQASPKLSGKPTLATTNGKVTVSYTLPLAKNRSDHSLVTWFVCADKACSDPKRAAVSRNATPLKTFILTPAMKGLYVMAEVAPAHDLSKPGPGQRVIATTPAPAIAHGPVTLDITSIPDAEATDRFTGDWQVTGPFVSEPPMDGEERWGYRIASGTHTLVYAGRPSAGDMDITLELDSDKLEGQVMGMPGGPTDADRLRGDILFKYDAATRSGYGLRIWRTTQSSSAAMFQVYRIVDGKGVAVGPQQLTGVMKPTTKIVISVRGGHVSITGSNTEDAHTLSLATDIEPNRNAGAGLYWPGAGRGGSIVVRSLKIDAKD